MSMARVYEQSLVDAVLRTNRGSSYAARFPMRVARRPIGGEGERRLAALLADNEEHIAP